VLPRIMPMGQHPLRRVIAVADPIVAPALECVRLTPRPPAPKLTGQLKTTLADLIEAARLKKLREQKKP
jgi:hypothetical protein